MITAYVSSSNALSICTASGRILVFLIGLICLLASGCGSRRETAIATEPAADLAVTTLEKPDIDRVARALQLHGTILMGCKRVSPQLLSPPVTHLVGIVRDQIESGGRDLDALVKLKNAPMPVNLGVENSRLLDALEHPGATAKDAAVITFFRAIHINALRLMRDLADRAQDPDVRAFAARQLSGIVATMHHLDRLAARAP